MKKLNSVVPFLGEQPVESFYSGSNKIYGRNILLGADKYSFEQFFINKPVINNFGTVNLQELKGLIGSRVSLSFDLELINAKYIGDIGYTILITHTDGTTQQVSSMYNTSIGKAYKGAFTSYLDIQTKEISSVSGYRWVVGVAADYVKLTNPKFEYGVKTDFTIAPEDV